MTSKEAFEEAYKKYGGKPEGSGEYLRSEDIWREACKWQMEQDKPKPFLNDNVTFVDQDGTIREVSRKEFEAINKITE